MDRKKSDDPPDKMEVIDDMSLLGVIMWLFILFQIAWALRPKTIC